MSEQYGKKVVVTGGSSVAFSVMGIRMLENDGLATVNMGLEAPFGSAVLTNWVLAELRRGDTLILAIEPPRLTCEHDLFSSGCKFANVLRHPEWAYMPWEHPIFPYWASAMKSNVGWKRIVGIGKSYFSKKKKPRWPYTIAETDASGWQTTSRKYYFDELTPYYGTHLSADNRKLLYWIRQWCDQRGVRVAYSLPWAYTEPENAAILQKTNAALLQEIAEILPVLKDTRLGAYGGRSNFIDTCYHLNPATAALRSDELARQIKDWSVWQPGELEARISVVW